jgi:hypothetical protein
MFDPSDQQQRCLVHRRFFRSVVKNSALSVADAGACA